MRAKGSWSDTTFRARATEATSRGSATFEGEQRAREGKGLDPLVDPSKFEVIRGANNLLVPKDDKFVLEFGVAMPVETDADTTGSMGGNVEILFGAMPKTQNLLVQGTNAVLRRYHTQIATGVMQDKVDKFPYERSQFEPDNEVERQMSLLVPEKGGGDSTEDYQVALFGVAYLTKASITQYGLRGYYFPVADAIGRDRLEKDVLEQVFGPSVWEKAFGTAKAPQSLPSNKDVAKKLLEDWHAFFLQVKTDPYTTRWWANLLGAERIVRLPRTEEIAEVEAVIIGLTEGVLDLQTAAEFLRNAKVSREKTVGIIEAVRGIPIGLQKTFPNFSKIPMAGAIFADREDIWPIGTPAGTKKAKKAGEETGTEPKPDKGKKKAGWKV
jgi:hypothetical protein